MVRPGGTLLCRRLEYFRDNPFSGAARPDPHYKGAGAVGPEVQVQTGTDDLNRLIGLNAVKDPCLRICASSDLQTGQYPLGQRRAIRGRRGCVN